MKTKIKLMSIAALSVAALFTGCSKDDPDPTISVTNFTGTIAENPYDGQSIGFVDATVEDGNHTRYEFIPNSTIRDHVSINSNGELTVANSGFFDYEQNTSISGSAEVITFDDNDKEFRASFSVTINITDVNEAAALSVQERLDGGETPSAIYYSNSALLDSLYGKTYAGGLIAYLNTASGNGFVVASADQSTSLIWDPNQPAGSGTAGTNDAIGNGPLNTNAIVGTIGAGSYAAQICNDLILNSFSDWFLPSRDELTQVYNNLHVNGLGNFQNISYWSSSETTTTTIVWYRKFDTGQEGMAGAEQLFGVRAARTF